MITGNSLIHSSGEVHRFRTSDVSQATLASVSPVFTVVSMSGTFDNVQNILLVLINWVRLVCQDNSFCFMMSHVTYKSCCLCLLLSQ